MQRIKEFDRYMIDTKGNVYSCIKGRQYPVNTGVPQRILKQVLDTTGYYIVTLTNENRKVNKSIHRLLAMHFIPNPLDLPHVNHKDGVKTNNSLINLEWVSEMENTQHAITTGLTDPKERHPGMSIVLQLDMVGALVKEHKSLHEAGRDTNIAWQNISKVCRGLRKSAGDFKWEYK